MGVRWVFIVTDSFDLGQILANYGYVPCATFKPGTTVVHITSTVGVTPNRSANHHRSRGASTTGLINSSFRGLFVSFHYLYLSLPLILVRKSSFVFNLLM